MKQQIGKRRINGTNYVLLDISGSKVVFTQKEWARAVMRHVKFQDSGSYPGTKWGK